jgi:uncharacterized protein
MDPIALGVLLLVVVVSFGLSAAAGMGGSLLLVPALAIALGTKEGVALAALLLACNNVVKVAAYRATLPFAAAVGMMLCTAAGAGLGARLLVAAPTWLVSSAVIVCCAGALVIERIDLLRTRRASAPGLAFASGATSGFAGTSGPLKAIALRGLGLDRRHMVGAACLVSLAGDASKAAVFARAGLLDVNTLRLAVLAVPLMLTATFLGRRINEELGERGYRVLFWGVIGGYSLRLLTSF